MKQRIHNQPNILRKFSATLIDYGIYMTFWFFCIMHFGTPNDEGGYTLSGWPALLLFLSWFVYFPLIESINGQTLGHYFIKLKVVTLNGDNITFRQALKRRLTDCLELFFSFGFIAFLVVKNSEKHQRVGDLWAKTIVVGGEKIKCHNCGERLTLLANETVKGTYTCPSCNSENPVTLLS